MNTMVKDTVMVIPYIIGYAEDNVVIGMIDMSKPIIKDMIIRIDANAFGRTLGPVERSCIKQDLPVFTIGNYKISIAKSKEDILNNIDWTQFTKSSDFANRLKTLDHETLYPTKYKWCYIIAQTTQDANGDGFGFIIPSIDIDYFPTAHENIKKYLQITGIDMINSYLRDDELDTELVTYDVNIINFTDNQDPLFNSIKFHNVNSIDITEDFKYERYYKDIDLSPIGVYMSHVVKSLKILFDDNIERTIEIDMDRFRHMNSYSIKSVGYNRNYLINRINNI